MLYTSHQFDTAVLTLKILNGKPSTGDTMPAGIENSISNQHLVEVSTKSTWLKKNSAVIDRRLVWILGTVCFVLCLGLVLICYKYVAVVTSECTSETCIRSAANLLQSMDQSVDPCEDFYAFACGRWSDEHPMPDAAFSHDWFNERRARIDHSIKDYLTQNDSDKEPLAVHQARTMFRACMDTEAIEAVEFSEIEQVMEEVGLTLLPPVKNAGFKWLPVSVNTKLVLNRDLLLQLSVGPDPFNHTINRISINRPEANSPLPGHRDLEKRIKRRMTEDLSLEVDGILTEGVRAYYSYVISLIKIFHSYKQKTVTVQGIIDEYVNTIREANKLINEIHELIENKTETDSEPTVYTLGQLQNLTDSYSEKRLIDWREYFTMMFENVDNVTLQLDDDDIILVHNPEYFEGLIEILEDTSPETVEFMFWLDIVQLLAPHSTKELRRLNHDFIEALTGIQNIKSRELQCTENVMQLMGMAVSYSILNDNNLETTRERVDEMVSNIRWAFEKVIERVDWMDRPTKMVTLEKVEAMRSFIGYPEWLSEPGQLDDYYSGLVVNETTYLENVRNMTRLLVENMLRSLNTTNDFESVWAVDPIDVNAFHTFQANAITIPMGILQYPFYNLGLEALNYGAIGSILGHELTHGFDDTGRKYDKTGNKLPWWSNKTINEYMNKTECFVEQYSSFYLPEINQSIDGLQTLDENIADNGGLREALWAYRHYVRNHGQEKTLPGLSAYSHEQLLFLSFANLWCESWTPVSMKWDMKDVHCPNRIRVLGVLSNSPEFAATWSCPKGTKMNPKKRKCQLW